MSEITFLDMQVHEAPVSMSAMYMVMGVGLIGDWC